MVRGMGFVKHKDFDWPSLFVCDVGEYFDRPARRYILYVLVPLAEGENLELMRVVHATPYTALNWTRCSKAKDELLAEAQALYAQQRQIALTVQALEGKGTHEDTTVSDAIKQNMVNAYKKVLANAHAESLVQGSSFLCFYK